MQINNSLALSVTEISETVKQKEPFEDYISLGINTDN